MNPLAYSTAIQACKELMDSQRTGDRRTFRHALSAAAAAVNFEASQVDYYIAVPTEMTSDKQFDGAFWVLSDKAYCCAFEAEAEAETTLRHGTMWKIVALTGLESGPQT